MLARQGVTIDRATLAGWVGRAAGYLKPIVDRQKAELLKSDRLFVDETTAKVLAPSSGKTKTGYLWALVRDDRPHRSEEHTSELQSLLRTSYAVFCSNKKYTLRSNYKI